MLRHLLRDSEGLYTIVYDHENMRCTVKVYGFQILRKGKPSLGRMLLQLHIYWCTADIDNCRKFYEELSHVDDETCKWREVVVARKDFPLVFCQANTYIDGGMVKLNEYETDRDFVRSWAEREIDSSGV